MTDLLNHGVQAEVYQPAPLWVPPGVNPNFSTAVTDYTFSKPTLRHEQDLAKVLAVQTKTIIPGVYGDTYRAARAMEQRDGNCMAQTEAGVAIAEQAGLEMMTVWGKIEGGSWHASSLWLGRVSLWDVDFYYRETHDAYLYNANASDKFSKLVRDTNANGQGFHLWTPAYPTGSFKYELIKNEPGQTPNPFANYTKGNVYTFLPPKKGIDMLGALGDLVRYRKEKPARYARLADQIMRFIPPGLIPAEED